MTKRAADPDVPIPPPPPRIGPYRVDEKISAGAKAEIYQGFDERLRRPVALKHIRLEVSKDPTGRKRVRREARAAARLTHSTIVKLYDWIETENGDWFVMELVEGRSMRQLLDEGPMSIDFAIRIARRLLEGLSVAHDEGLVHRDLKPANVMITYDDEIKILDFGLVKNLRADDGESVATQDGVLVGTVAAMSPEQAVGYPVDPRSDLFSLGSLLYEMLTGKSPFYDENAVQTLVNICRFTQLPTRKLVPSVSQELSDFIDWMLDKDPDRRPQSAQQALTALKIASRT